MKLIKKIRVKLWIYKSNIRYMLIKDRDVSIITNNCLGADISKSCHLKYNSPTVNLQIPPEDFIKFCSNLNHYLECDLEKLDVLDNKERKKYKRLFGDESPHFPLAKLDDIMIVFQHYDSFEEGKQAWNKRKQRIGKAIMFAMIVGKEYKEEADKFTKLGLKNQVLFTINWKEDTDKIKTCDIKIPENIHFMEFEIGLKKYYEQNFNAVYYINSISTEV